MKKDLYNYDIFPKVILEKTDNLITVRPLGKHSAFTSNTEYTVYIRDLGEGHIEDYPERNNLIEYKIFPNENGHITFTHSFEKEGEYFIDIVKDKKKLCNLSVYALKHDMKGRLPFKGDLHMHSTYSDGKESPEIVCANYRKIGYDFMTVSDHRSYCGSMEAIEAYKDVNIGLNIVPGEEIHLPDNDIHIINFGGDFSVNGILETHKQIMFDGTIRSSINGTSPAAISVQQYKDEVNALIPTLNIPDHIEKFVYASCVWIFNHVRRANGLGIFCHPYWRSNVIQVPETLTDYMMETAPFDAFEVLGGERPFSHNGYQTAMYYADMAKGRKYPIVGSTDSHGSVPEYNIENGTVASTIVFSKENSRDELISSIKDFYTVAIDSISAEYRLVGEFRFIQYGCFLMDNYFPLHDEICFDDGRLMKEYATGTSELAEDLERNAKRMDAYRKKYFAI